jgi:glycosyltransferase involved in cell wall biosynthesis
LSAAIDISVLIPAYNPHAGRLRETLAALRTQSLPPSRWETVIIDNASSRFPASEAIADVSPQGLRIVREPRLGLTYARIRGFTEARADLAICVDDDNVLDPRYLENVLAIFSRHPRLGIAGGRCVPGFESSPPAWVREFDLLLALRDLGDRELVSAGLRPPGAALNEYPAFAPLGAGMALRREAWAAWLNARSEAAGISDRKGNELTSGGDNDIVFCAMEAGWEVGYFPQLSLRHLIPPERTECAYLCRLNRGIQKSWMQVLRLHEANPWPPLTGAGAALRNAKAWISYRAWSTPAARVRWQGACGHFEGRVPRREDPAT